MSPAHRVPMTPLLVVAAASAAAALQHPPAPLSQSSPSARVQGATATGASQAAGAQQGRRAVLGAAFGAMVAATAAPPAAQAIIESTNPANNYYFPMAKYRYLPRIFRAWIATSELALPALDQKDWDGLQIVYDRLDDATTAMPLYTSAVEGSRSTKRKKKSEAQKEMIKSLDDYKKYVADLEKAIKSKDSNKARVALEGTTASLSKYRQLAQIDKEDGGLIKMPDGNPEEAGHAGAPLGYVVPAFRGGGTRNDFSLR